MHLVSILLISMRSEMFNAITYRLESCGVLAYVACCSNSPPFCSILPRFCLPIGFDSSRGRPRSGIQGKRPYTRAPPFAVGDPRACFTYRIAKGGRHDPDKHSLRQCHAMLGDLL